MLMVRIGYRFVYRWFAGLGVNNAVWYATASKKNCDRLVESEVAHAFLREVVRQTKRWELMISEACCHGRDDGEGRGQPEEFPSEAGGWIRNSLVTSHLMLTDKDVFEASGKD
ncbi:MAG: hypothetical protein ACP5UB_12310 [Candidatus Sumerlaeaceae bacterium]